MPPEVWCAWEAQHAAVARLAARGLEAALKLEDVAPEWLHLAASMLPAAEVPQHISAAEDCHWACNQEASFSQLYRSAVGRCVAICHMKYPSRGVLKASYLPAVCSCA